MSKAGTAWRLLREQGVGGVIRWSGRRAAKGMHAVKHVMLRCVEDGLFGRSYYRAAPALDIDVQTARAFLAETLPYKSSRAYNELALPGYLATMEYLRGLPRSTRVLEIGAAPYGMSLLLRRELFDNITLVSYTGHDRTDSPREHRFGSADAPIVLREFLFDAEREVWPFDAGAFDLVVVCHVMEHFARDPMFAFAEANRVLAPAGRLFVVVPNGASALHVDMLIRGETPNTCPFYSAIPSERHHREFTPGELRVLGEAAGFTVDRIETYNPGRCGAARLRTLLALGLLVEMRDRRDALAAVFVKSGPVRERRPTAMRLYRKAEG